MLANGAYGKRIIKMCQTMELAIDEFLGSEKEPITKHCVEKWLQNNKRSPNDYWFAAALIIGQGKKK